MIFLSQKFDLSLVVLHRTEASNLFYPMACKHGMLDPKVTQSKTWLIPVKTVPKPLACMAWTKYMLCHNSHFLLKQGVTLQNKGARCKQPCLSGSLVCVPKKTTCINKKILHFRGTVMRFSVFTLMSFVS